MYFLVFGAHLEDQMFIINAKKIAAFFAIVLSLSSCAQYETERIPAGVNDSSVVVSAPKYNLSVTGVSPVDLSLIKPVIDEALKDFETKVSTLQGEIQIAIGSSECLRVGYNFVSRIVHFCNGKNVIQFGIASRDIIRHELFHAMVCNVRPEICTSMALSSEDIAASHEALADFFAYQLEPKECFGENFYANQKCVRQYLTHFCYSLIAGPHGKGNALVSEFVRANLTLDRLQAAILQSTFLPTDILKAAALRSGACFDPVNAPQLNYVVSNYKKSVLNKYWINPESPLLLDFQQNFSMTDLFSNVQIKWTTEKGTDSKLFRVSKGQSITSFSIIPLSSSGVEKLIALIFNEGELIGEVTFYFGIKLNK